MIVRFYLATIFAAALHSALLADAHYSRGLRWHLIRITQRERLSGAQRAFGTRRKLFPPVHSDLLAPVNIYVVDSGVRVTHEEFEGRAEAGPDFVSGLMSQGDGSDCQGHGSSVGAIAAGRYSGVARNAHIISVRVLDCVGSGYCTNVLRALDWIARDSEKRARLKPKQRAVVVMSLGSRDSRCGATSLHTAALAARGVVVVAAAGNSRADSCRFFPARNAATISVGATDEYDRLFKNNNRGACIDVLAPGVRIISAWGNATDFDYRAASGTSMATPLVAGTAALALAADPQLDSAQVRQIILSGATVGKAKNRKGELLDDGIVNRILFAPWAGLFENVRRDLITIRKARAGQKNLRPRMGMVELSLFPRVRPAMLYSAHAIRDAVAKVGGFHIKTVLVRRAPRVQILKNGSEPTAIKLRLYFDLHKNKTRKVQRIDRAVRSGEIERISREKVRFQSFDGGSYVKENVELPETVRDRAKRGAFIDLDATSIVLITLICWILFMLMIITGTSIWKKKFGEASHISKEGSTKRRQGKLTTIENVHTLEGPALQTMKMEKVEILNQTQKTPKAQHS